jgi:hypothetical protein
METSFQKKSAGDEPKKNEETDVVTTDENGLPLAHTQQFGAGELDGEFGASDFKLPYLSLVNKTGQLSNDFQPGSFLYNKEVVVSDGKEPFLVTALGMKKDYVEDIEFDSEIMPRSFTRLADAEGEGYSLDYEADKRVKERAMILTLVPVPEDYGTFFAPDHLTEFLAEQADRLFSGKPRMSWALAMWIVQSSAYNAVAKPLATAKMGGHLRGGLHHGPWVLQSELKNYRSNSWYAPRIRSGGRHSPEFIQWIEQTVLPKAQ